MDESEEIPDEMETVTKLQAAVGEIEDPLRRLGLYVSTSAIAPSEHGPVVLVDCLIGDAALSDRVQDPDKDASDDVFRQMEREERKNDFERTKEDIARRLAEGKSLFGDD